MSKPFDRVDKVMHNVVLEAIDHYYSNSVLDTCPGPCGVCLAVKQLGDIVGEPELQAYIKMAKEKIES